MKARHFAVSLISAAVAFTPATRVAAEAGDAIAGALVGAIIGGAIVNENNKKRRVATGARTSSSGVSSAQRAANREVQTALNYFGFPVGAADGAIGRQTRAGISDYQATLGYPATGQLTDYERNLLVTSYQRAMAGGAMTNQQIAANPMGARGLLLSYRDQQAGFATAAAPVVPLAPLAPVAPVAAAAEAAAEPEPPVAPLAAAQGSAALPNFLATQQGAATSLASYCNAVSLETSANGGFVTLAAMDDPKQALGEQFCLARAQSIAQGEQLAAAVQGFTPAQISEQCAGFGPAMQPHVNAMSMRPADAVLPGVAGFAADSGMAPAQLAATARICLSVGYRDDNMDVALGSALLLTALGEGAYGELLGHHLSQGIGASTRPDLALGWYDMGFAAGQAPFSAGQPGRTDLIRKAAYTLGGRDDQAALDTAPALPDFGAAIEATAPAAAPAPEAPVVATAEAAEAPAMALTETAAAPGPVTDALPLAVRLPFLLFKN